MTVPPWLLRVAPELGASDCETVEEGLIAQPVNTLTSLGYAAVGIWIMRSRPGEPADTRACRLAFGVLLLLVAFGSVLYHGMQPSWGRFAHDLSNAVAVWALIGYDLGELSRAGLRTVAVVATIGVAGLAALFVASPDSSTVVTEALVAVAIVLEALAYRRRGGFAAWRSEHSAQHLTAAALTVVAVVAYLFGGTDDVLCRPDGLLQPHGAWHLLTAAAIGLVADAAFARSKMADIPIR